MKVLVGQPGSGSRLVQRRTEIVERQNAQEGAPKQEDSGRIADPNNRAADSAEMPLDEVEPASLFELVMMPASATMSRRHPQRSEGQQDSQQMCVCSLWADLPPLHSANPW